VQFNKLYSEHITLRWQVRDAYSSPPPPHASPCRNHIHTLTLTIVLGEEESEVMVGSHQLLPEEVHLVQEQDLQSGDRASIQTQAHGLTIKSSRLWAH